MCTIASAQGFHARNAESGYTLLVTGSTPEQLFATIKSEMNHLWTLIKAQGIREE